MKIEEKIKYQYTKILYESLSLKTAEEYLKENGIKAKEIKGDQSLKIGEYFFLYNKVTLDRLSEEEKKYLEDSFKEEIIEINKKENIEEINEFLLVNIPRILFPEIESKYIHYGQTIDPLRVIPTDSICLVCHYIRFEGDSIKNQEIVNNVLNYIQEEFIKIYKVKFSTIACDELLML